MNGTGFYPVTADIPKKILLRKGRLEIVLTDEGKVFDSTLRAAFSGSVLKAQFVVNLCVVNILKDRKFFSSSSRGKRIFDGCTQAGASERGLDSE